MHVTLTITNGQLTCQVVSPPTTNNPSLIYRLFRHSTKVFQSDRTNQLSYIWNADRLAASGGGDFHVQVEWRGDSPDDVRLLTTEWQFIPSAAARNAYIKWVTDEMDGPSPLLPLEDISPAPIPYHHIAVIVLKNVAHPVVQERLWKLAQQAKAMLSISRSNGAAKLSFERVEPGHNFKTGDMIVFSTSRPVSMDPGASGLGSGFAYHQGTLLRENEVIGSLDRLNPESSNRRARYSSKTCGDFHAAVFTNSHVEFHSDFFGTSCWSHYEDEEIHIVGSSFLLAVRIAQALNRDLSLNLETIDLDFCSLTQVFQQPLSDDLELAGFSLLPPDEVLFLTPEGTVYKEPSQLGLDVARPLKFSAQAYEDHLLKATTEIKDNCRAIAQSSAYNTVVCDVSGGLDSRLVLAAFLANPDSLDRLRLRTQPPDRAPSPKDEDIALLIAQVAGVPWDDSAVTVVGPCHRDHLISKLASASFGVYWLRGPSHSTLAPDLVHVGGTQLGEICRDYVAKGWNLKHTDVRNPDDLVFSLAKQIFRWRGKATMKPTPAAGVEEIGRTWERLPGDEIDEGSQIFNFHRARFHGCGIVPAWFGEQRMNPGPSRSVFLLKMMTSRVFAPYQLQLDLIFRLNPTLARIPYGDEGYNQAFRDAYGIQTLDIQPDRSALDAARARSSVKRSQIPCPACATRDTESEIPEKQRCLSVLHGLCQLPELQDILLPAYRWATAHLGSTYPLDHTYCRVFRNKVYHLAYMVDFVNRVDDQAGEETP